jgi:hypothetical protein
MPLLADIFSAGNTAKRKIKAFAADPLASIEQFVNQRNAQAGEFNRLGTIAEDALYNRMMGKPVSPDQQAAFNQVNDILASAYNPVGMTGYHGSPHGPISQFSLEKVGTGAGTRNFGEGIYIAEHPAVAGAFRKGRIPSTQNPEGFLYKVDVPDELLPKMLNWYEDVPEEMRKTLSAKAMEQFGSGLSPSTGERLYKDLAFSFKSMGSKTPEKDAAAWLAKQGVPGIKYENLQMIKGQGRDTHNYVMFQPEKVKIEEINDIPLADWYAKGFLKEGQ